MKYFLPAFAILASVKVSAQNVGIGTTSPNRSKLQVEYDGSQAGILVRSTSSFASVDIDGASGEAGLRLFNNGSMKWLLLNNPTGDNLEFYEIGGGTRLTLQSATGNVGIGTNSPSAKAHIEYGGASTGLLVKSTANFATIDIDAKSGEAGLRLKNNGTPRWIMYNTTANGLSIFDETGGSRIFVEAGSGNVGIGTTVPLAKLDVNGYVASSGLQIGGGTAINKIQSGTVTLGPSGNSLAAIYIAFPTSFASTPKVVVTARSVGGSNFDDTFATTLRSVNFAGFYVNVKRVDATGGWAQNLQLDWIAIQ